MIKNNDLKLFERDYSLQGSHASKIKFFKDEAKLFDTYIDVYMNAVVFGYLQNKRSPKDTSSSDRARIYADAFASNRNTCMFLYRIITLMHYKQLNEKECIDRAFRYDSDKSKEDLVKENIDVFNSYVRGGIEVMYKLFIEDCGNSKDDYIKRSFDVVREFESEIKGDQTIYDEQIREYIEGY